MSPNCPFLWGIQVPTQNMVSLAHPSPYPKRNPDRFSLFGKVHGCDQQTREEEEEEEEEAKRGQLGYSRDRASLTFHAPVVHVLGESVDDGQVAVAVADLTQPADEVVGDVVDRSDEAVHLRLTQQLLAELRPVLVPLAALPVYNSPTNNYATYWS